MPPSVAFKRLRKVGRVIDVTGLVIESEGPDVPLGQVCEIASDRHAESFTAEVVGFRGNRVLLIPLEEMHGIHPGCQVVASPRGLRIPVGLACSVGLWMGWVHRLMEGVP
jgi:flagellum-specific ATP synthase